jgi:serine/threonine protein kinase
MDDHFEREIPTKINDDRGNQSQNFEIQSHPRDIKYFETIQSKLEVTRDIDTTFNPETRKWKQEADNFIDKVNSANKIKELILLSKENSSVSSEKTPVLPEKRMFLTKHDFIKHKSMNLGCGTGGKGSFGYVYNGTFMGAPIAIKEFSMKSLPSHLSGEFDNHKSIAHPNILGFYGICITPGKFSMLMEVMPDSLRSFYLKYVLTIGNVINIVEQIARGLGFLHSFNISHKHLKSNNIFISESGLVKLADFGLSKIKLESSSNGATNGEASVRWRAPETFTREYGKIRDTFEACMYADMYSYGLLLWECVHDKFPFQEHTESQVVQLLSVGTRPEWTVPTPFLEYKELATACLEFVPNKRPTTTTVLEIFNKIPAFNIISSRAEQLRVTKKC